MSWSRITIRIAVILLCVLTGVAAFLADKYSQYLLNLILIYIIVGIGLNMLLGYAGQFAFVHAALMGVGAYVTAVFTTKLGISFWISLPLAGLITACFGGIIALPAMRISRVYLALLTLGVAQLLVWVFLNWYSVTGGTDGIELNAPHFFGWRVRGDQGIFLVVFPIVILMYWLARRILDSRLGRSFVTIRESEIVARCSGIDVPRTKMIVFFLSGLYAGIGGGLYALTLGFIVPDSFGIAQVTLHFSVVLLGGLMSLPGVIIGSLLLTALPEVLRDFQAWQEMLYGLILMIVILAMPSGIAGVLKTWGLLPQEVLARNWRRFIPNKRSAKAVQTVEVAR